MSLAHCTSEGHVNVHLERAASQSCCYKKGFLHGGKSDSGRGRATQPCGLGPGGRRVKLHALRLILPSVFAQALGPLPPPFLAPELSAWRKAILPTAGSRSQRMLSQACHCLWHYEQAGTLAEGHGTVPACDGRRREKEFMDQR